MLSTLVTLAGPTLVKIGIDEGIRAGDASTQSINGNQAHVGLYRGEAKGAGKVMILLTDGKPYDSDTYPAGFEVLGAGAALSLHKAV